MDQILMFMTENDCYKAGRKIKVAGIMVHSTATPGVMAEAWYDKWNKPGVQKAVHAFVDDKVVMQYLPWNHRAWHCGDSGNNTHVAFEMCEPKDLNDREYFEKAYANAVELCIMLCRQYGLTEKDIICHSEGYKLGIASNHADVMHWFPKHGKSMDTFRAAVKAELNKKAAPVKHEVDNKVLELQKVLNRLQIRDGKGNALEEDGKYGPRTTEAVKRLQSICNITIDGKAGPQTWSIINQILDKLVTKKSARGIVVRYIQFRVGTTTDGSFGPATDRAVKAWQSNNNLASDGSVGPATWKALIG